jgi:PAS domain S-box-containing protein
VKNNLRGDAISTTDHLSEKNEKTELFSLRQLPKGETCSFGFDPIKSPSIVETLSLCLESALLVSGMDAGGIYIRVLQKGGLALFVHTGLSDGFADLVSYYPPSSEQIRLLKNGVPIYFDHQDLIPNADDPRQREGLKSMAVLPFYHHGELISYLNVASHNVVKVSHKAKKGLDAISSRIGSTIIHAITEEEVKRTHDNLVSLFNTLGDFLFVLDETGRVLETNEIVKKRLGYSQEELVGMPIDRLHPSARKEEALSLLVAMLDGNADSCPIPIQTKTGEQIPVETKVVQGVWDGHPALFGISRDISFKIMAEKAAKRKSSLISLLVDLSVTFISQDVKETDRSLYTLLMYLGNFFTVDRAYVFLFDGENMSNTHEWCANGVEPQRAILQDLPRAIFPFSMRKFESGQGYSFMDIDEMPDDASPEKEIMKKQGIQSVLLTPLFNRLELIGFIGFDAVRKQIDWPKETIELLKVASELISNVLNKQKNHQALIETQIRLEENKTKLQHILDMLPIGIAHVERNGTIRYANRILGELCEIPTQKLIGTWVQNLFGQNGDGTRALSDFVLGGVPAHGEPVRVKLNTKKGRLLWIELRSIFNFDDKGGGLILFQDISELESLRKRDETKNFHGVIYRSQTMANLIKHLQPMARTDLPVLIQGETGTGKEMIARAIHEESKRKAKPFIAVNCAGLTDSLLHSQLLGHRRGAFTGAIADQRGYFEMANGGTLFLDEIADASPSVQKIFLRILEDGLIHPAGARKPITVDVRILAATNRNIGLGKEKDLFREDLFYRLSAVRVRLPPLRERSEDISPLTEFFLGRLAGESESPYGPTITKQAMERLLCYRWPGNVRQLKNAVTVAYFHSGSSPIYVSALPNDLQDSDFGAASFVAGEMDEKTSILHALDSCDGNRSKAADMLGMSRSTFYRRLMSHGIT